MLGDAIAYHQQGRAWLITDQGSKPPALQDDFLQVAQGNTISDLARQLGFPKGALQDSVAYYNRHAAKSEDPLFHKHESWLKPLDEPPFAALACHLKQAYYPFFTLGGLRVRPTGEVLTTDGDAIAGLYAAGRTACGLPRWGKGYSSGMSLGDCTFFGRKAGKQAATSPLA